MQKKYIMRLLSLVIATEIVACSSGIPPANNSRAYFNHKLNDYAYCNEESCPQPTQFTIDEEEPPIYIAPPIIVKDKLEERIDVHYDFSKSYLRKADITKLETAFNRLKGKDLDIVIIGYTDNVEAVRKKSQFNNQLAKERATVVKNFLIKHYGVKDASIKIEGKPLCCYVASNKTKKGRAENRRSEVKIYIQ